jgi:hypothetical protein
MTWAQRVRAVFSTPLEFVSPEAEKSDLLLEALEGQAEASVRAEYEPQIQKLRDELDGLRQKEYQRYPRHMAFDYADPFRSIRLERGSSPLDQMLAEKLDLARAYELLKPVQPVAAEPSKAILDSLCSLMTCGADEVLGLVTEYRAAYDRYAVLAERLGVELSTSDADSEVTRAFSQLKRVEEAHSNLLSALETNNQNGALREIEILKGLDKAYHQVLEVLGVQDSAQALVRISGLRDQILSLEGRNNALGQENVRLRDRLSELEKPVTTISISTGQAIEPVETPSEGQKPPVESDPLRKLDWVEMTQVFRELVKLDSVGKIAIPKFNLTNADVRRFAELYADELRRYREASNPQKGGHIQQFSAARRAEEWRPKAPK